MAEIALQHYIAAAPKMGYTDGCQCQACCEDTAANTVQVESCFVAYFR